ncbi:MAG: hypothetical protein ACFFDN_20055 [Candidatus Hodarchaeota archaeon]
MGSYNNGKRNGITYHNKSLKRKIENSQRVKNVRKKLMESKLRKIIQD